MSGIVFMATRALETVEGFYVSRMGMEVWIRQEDCVVLRHGDMALGFCQREDADTGGTITFLCETDEQVNDLYRKLRDVAEGAPALSEKYRIYHFFLRDPEGRRLEVQRFLDL